ncbi:MAG: DUF3999 domain-containing protein [Cephaloticoccus sp.]|nr:DUF3999 domain-containing protein [Cephaloticoccus sp.]
MKNRRPHQLDRLLALFVLLAGPVAAALTTAEWQYQQKLPVAAPGLVQMALNPVTFDTAQAQLQDLRVIDPADREVAILLDQPPALVAQTVRPKSFVAKVENGNTVITLTTGTAGELLAVSLETPHPYFLKTARVELSDDLDQWTEVDRGALLFRQWGAEKLSLKFERHRAAYVRITIDDQRGPVLPFTGASMDLAAGPAPGPVPVGAQILRQDEFAGETVLTLELEGRHLPLTGLEFACTDPLFMRHVTVSVREVRDTMPTERTIGSGTIYRVELEGATVRSQLRLPFNFTPASRQLLVHIHNGDSPPLNISAVQGLRRPVTLRFVAPIAGTYTLLSGNPQVEAPRYDLATFAHELRTATASPVFPGKLLLTADYRPRASLSTTPLADVPLRGAPLDTQEWRLRRAIVIAHSGVQELELDPLALARSQVDFGDLRIMREGNQIPYLLEQPALARAIKLTPVAANDPRQPSVSRWQLHLPQAGLPISRIALTSTTPLFSRQFRIFEKLTQANGQGYELNLAAGGWSRTPEPGSPENRVFELGSRPKGDTIWIETDNGDNPAIDLGAVQVIHPVVRLIFKVPEIDGYALVYGNKSALKPRYDLSLVAVRLLTASRNDAFLVPAEQNTGQRNLFSMLKGGYVLWSALALVVIGLLVVVAKLLPKPPGA